MRFFVGITDGDWFSYLSSFEDLDEVNFWQPSGTVDFKALLPGEPFLFKLHSPLSGQGKSGHAWSLQNRPYGMARDVVLIYPAFS